MIVMLFISGYIVALCERQSIDVTDLYPAPSSGCDDIDALYPDNESLYLTDAYNQYIAHQ
jgi:hypothetical protein